MFPRPQYVRPGLPGRLPGWLSGWGHALLLAALIGLFAVGPAAGPTAALCAAPAGRLAESEAPPEQGEEDCKESASLPSAPRSVRPPATIPTSLRSLPGGPRRLASALGSHGRPLAVSGLPLVLPLRC